MRINLAGNETGGTVDDGDGEGDERQGRRETADGRLRVDLVWSRRVCGFGLIRIASRPTPDYNYYNNNPLA